MQCSKILRRWMSKKTPFYDEHKKLGGKMVDFCGWALPSEYSNVSLVNSHLHTRSSASLFDVSHMFRTHITGPSRVAFLETLTGGDVSGMKVGDASLMLLTNASGGIIDDMVVLCKEDGLSLVLNAGAASVTSRLLHEAKTENVTISDEEDKALLALQGPKAQTCLQAICNYDLSTLSFMKHIDVEILGHQGCHVTRCGYTGEDGFELSIPNHSVCAIFEHLTQHPDVLPAGLGSRNTLRLEAGLCLSGHDISENFTPPEAGLSWTIPKKRRLAADFPGAQRILNQLQSGVDRKRVGLKSAGPQVAREGAKVWKGDIEVGFLTSGSFAPSLGYPIGMGYINAGFNKVGTELELEIRGKRVRAEVVKMPFLPSRYFRV